MDWNQIKRQLPKMAKYIVWLGSILFAIWVILHIARVGIAIWIYSYIGNWVTTRLGLDFYMAEFIAITLSVLSALAIPYIAWFILLGRKKWIAVFAIIAITGGVTGLVYTVGKDVYFDRKTGKPLRYYADTPEGRVFSFTDGYETKYGIKFEAYTSEVAKRQVAKKHDPIPPGVGFPKSNPRYTIVSMGSSVESAFVIFSSEPINFRKRPFMGDIYPWKGYGISVTLKKLYPTKGIIGFTVLDAAVCNNGDEERAYEFDLSIWFTSKDMVTTRWNDNIPPLMPGECSNFSSLSVQGYPIKPPFGSLNIMVNNKVSSIVSIPDFD